MLFTVFLLQFIILHNQNFSGKAIGHNFYRLFTRTCLYMLIFQHVIWAFCQPLTHVYSPRCSCVNFGGNAYKTTLCLSARPRNTGWFSAFVCQHKGHDLTSYFAPKATRQKQGLPDVAVPVLARVAAVAIAADVVVDVALRATTFTQRLNTEFVVSTEKTAKSCSSRRSVRPIRAQCFPNTP